MICYGVRVLAACKKAARLQSRVPASAACTLQRLLLATVIVYPFLTQNVAAGCGFR